MSQLQLIILALSATIVSAGCRNRCGNQYGNGYFAGSPTIAAAPTGSLSIPSMANNRPYYVPGQSGPAGISATLDPNLSAPRPNYNPNSNQPNVTPPNAANLNGWRPTNENTPGANNNSGQSVLSAPTIFAAHGAASNGYGAAAGTGMPGSGNSYTDSTNYQSTRVNETQDPTRLAATDATNVRAPARNFPTGTMPGMTPSGQPIYQANPMVGRTPVYLAQPVLRGAPSYLANPIVGAQPAVLAQATTTYDPYNGGAGWRDREISSESYNR